MGNGWPKLASPNEMVNVASARIHRTPLVEEFVLAEPVQCTQFVCCNNGKATYLQKNINIIKVFIHIYCKPKIIIQMYYCIKTNLFQASFHSK